MPRQSAIESRRINHRDDYPDMIHNHDRSIDWRYIVRYFIYIYIYIGAMIYREFTLVWIMEFALLSALWFRSWWDNEPKNIRCPDDCIKYMIVPSMYEHRAPSELASWPEKSNPFKEVLDGSWRTSKASNLSIEQASHEHHLWYTECVSDIYIYIISFYRSVS